MKDSPLPGEARAALQAVTGRHSGGLSTWHQARQVNWGHQGNQGHQGHRGHHGHWGHRGHQGHQLDQGHQYPHLEPGWSGTLEKPNQTNK